MSTFVKQSEVEQEQFDWGTIGWRAAPANTGAESIVVMDVTLEPGEGHAFHRHDGQEEMIIVKQGADHAVHRARVDDARAGRLGVHRRGRRARLVQRRRRDGAPAGRDRARRSATRATGSSTSPARSPGPRRCAERSAARRREQLAPRRRRGSTRR